MTHEGSLQHSFMILKIVDSPKVRLSHRAMNLVELYSSNSIWTRWPDKAQKTWHFRKAFHSGLQVGEEKAAMSITWQTSMRRMSHHTSFTTYSQPSCGYFELITLLWPTDIRVDSFDSQTCIVILLRSFFTELEIVSWLYDEKTSTRKFFVLRVLFSVTTGNWLFLWIKDSVPSRIMCILCLKANKS